MTQKGRMERWRVVTSQGEGLHNCVTPEVQDCRTVHILRLNLLCGHTKTICTGELEMNFVLVAGSARVECPHFSLHMSKLDSFYLPGHCIIAITATADCFFYIGGAVCEGYGAPFCRKFDPTLPLGNIHQIHGHGVGEREVFFTLNPEVPASRLLCGLTWGGNGSWTSWPPHQHERDLEEAYCYFDMEPPSFGLHLSYLKSGREEEAVAHIVCTGTVVLAPAGYHPTVATPGTRNVYLWVLAAHSHQSRRYDLAVSDPNYAHT